MRKKGSRLAKIRGRGITFMTIPDATGVIKKWRIPLPFLLVLGVFLFIMTVTVGYVTLTYTQRTFQITAYRQQLEDVERENQRLTTVIDEQETRLTDLATEAEILQTQLVELEEVTSQIEQVLKVKVSELKGKQSSVPEVRIKPPVQISSRGGEVDATNGEDVDEVDAVEETHAQLVALQAVLPQSAQRLSQLSESATVYSDRRSRVPSIWPVTGRITSEFGARKHPIEKIVKQHDGIDIAASMGTPLRATANGVVSFTGLNGGYGWTVIIDHGYGVKTLYAHNQKNIVKKGQRVSRGEVIAYVGSTGISTGPHVHYEIQLNGKPVNPRNYLP